MLLVVCLYSAVTFAAPAEDGRGCMDSSGKIFQIVKTDKNGKPLYLNGLLIYKGFGEINERPDICFQTTNIGRCIIEGKNKINNEVYVSITECPFNSWVVPLLVALILAVIMYRIKRVKETLSHHS